MKTLLCGAVESEVSRLRDANLDNTVIELIGVGPIRSAAGMQAALDRHPDASEVILLGTCGSYSTALKIGDLISVQTVHFATDSALRNEAYVPGDIFPPLTCQVMDDFIATDVVTVHEITSEPKRIARLTSHYKAHAEHMEAYAAADVCLQAGIPITILLSVANSAGPLAHAEWLKHHQSVSDDLQDRVLLMRK